MSRRIVKTVVTHLRMQRPPLRLPPQPVGPRLALMRADPVPLHFYRYLYATVGGEWLWLERLDLDDAALAERVQRDEVEVWALYANGAPAGFFELDFGQADSAQLVYFGLMPEWRGRRIGPWLLGEAVSEAFRRGAGELRVQTCTLDHPKALPLYQRMGFEPAAQEERTLKLPPGREPPPHFDTTAP